MGFYVDIILKQATLKQDDQTALKLISGERYGYWCVDGDPSTVLKYVHQLQNYYHNTTGG